MVLTVISNVCRSWRWSWWWRGWRRRGTSTLASSGRSSSISSSSNSTSGTLSSSSRRRQTRGTSSQVSGNHRQYIFTIFANFDLTKSNRVMMSIPRQDLGGALRHWGRFCSSCRWGGGGDAPASLWLLDNYGVEEVDEEEEDDEEEEKGMLMTFRKLWSGPISLWLVGGNLRKCDICEGPGTL